MELSAILATLERVAQENYEPSNSKPSEAFLAANTPILLGVILEPWPALQCYTVAVNGSIRVANVLNEGTKQGLGVNSFFSYVPGTRVVLISLSGDLFILGSFAQSAETPAMYPHQLIPRDNIGLFREPAYYSEIVKNANIKNYGVKTPHDALPGDWGVINELGMSYFLGRLLMLIKASEAAKLELYPLDDLVRLVGYNYELWTNSVEHAILDDEGEAYNVWRSTPYTWESRGVIQPDNSSLLLSDGVSVDAAHKEPQEPNQMGIWRHQIYRGFLGGVEHEFISLPPNITGVEKLSNENSYPGVLETIKHIDGTYAVRSAKEITFEKYSLIPTPKQLKAPDDPAGDNATNYKASHVFGDVELAEPDTFEWVTDDPVGRSVQLLDYHTHLFNEKLRRNINAHSKDLYVPEEKDVFKDRSEQLKGFNVALLSESGNKHRMPSPTAVEVAVDSETSTEYYASRSIIKQTDDGSIILEDGYGSQIIMSGGNIYISPALDVVLTPGRSTINWSPQDIINKAGNSVDISASQKDVRIKAENNLHMLGGNSGRGGVLIESRSKGLQTAAGASGQGEDVNIPGVTIKAAESRIGVIGQQLSLVGTQRLDLSTSQTAGRLSLSSANTVLKSNSTAMSGSRLALQYDGIIVGGTIIADGSIRAMGGLFTDSNIGAGGWITANGSISGSRVNSHARGLGRLNEIPRKPDMESTRDALTRTAETVQELTDAVDEAVYNDPESALANTDVIAALGFSFRTQEQYLVTPDDFLFYEPRWQQLRRLGGSFKIWIEPIVKSPSGEDTQPHPGHTAWTTEGYYKGYRMRRVNYHNGYGTSAEDGEIDDMRFDEDYVVITP